MYGRARGAKEPGARSLGLESKPMDGKSKGVVGGAVDGWGFSTEGRGWGERQTKNEHGVADDAGQYPHVSNHLYLCECGCGCECECCVCLREIEMYCKRNRGKENVGVAAVLPPWPTPGGGHRSEN